jgi:hypothetical protein
MAIITLILLVGVVSTAAGFGPLSLRKNPAMGEGFAILGFLLRVVGPLFLVFGTMLLGRVLF